MIGLAAPLLMPSAIQLFTCIMSLSKFVWATSARWYEGLTCTLDRRSSNSALHFFGWLGALLDHALRGAAKLFHATQQRHRFAVFAGATRSTLAASLVFAALADESAQFPILSGQAW